MAQTFKEYLDIESLMADPQLDARLAEGFLSKLVGAAKAATMSNDDKIKEYEKALLDPKTPASQVREMKAFLKLHAEKNNMSANAALKKREKLEKQQAAAISQAKEKASVNPSDVWKGRDTERRGQ